MMPSVERLLDASQNSHPHHYFARVICLLFRRRNRRAEFLTGRNIRYLRNCRCAAGCRPPVRRVWPTALEPTRRRDQSVPVRHSCGYVHDRQTPQQPAMLVIGWRRRRPAKTDILVSLV